MPDYTVWPQIGLAPRFVIALLAVGVFWSAGEGLRLFFHRVGRRADAGQRELFAMLGRVAKLALIGVGLVVALSMLSVNVSALFAGLGLTGFAIGFALKDAISNVLGGILILIYRPFRVADRIGVAGFEGHVIEIDLRYTTLQEGHRRFLIPNSMLFTNTVMVVDAPA